MEDSTKKGMALWKKVLIGFALVFFIGAFYNGFVNGSTKENKRPKQKLDTAYIIARQALKKVLKDPDSYQEIDHREYYVDGKDSARNDMQVIISYRSKNGFGGYVPGKKAISLDSSLTVIDFYDPSN